MFALHGVRSTRFRGTTSRELSGCDQVSLGWDGVIPIRADALPFPGTSKSFGHEAILSEHTMIGELRNPVFGPRRRRGRHADTVHLGKAIRIIDFA